MNAGFVEFLNFLHVADQGEKPFWPRFRMV